MLTDETFFAWLDGELDPVEAARVEAEVAADPRLSAMAAEHRAMQAKLKGAFEPVLDAPLPERLLAAIRNPAEAEVVDFAQAKKRRESRWPSIPQWGAMAATLAIGVLIGTIVPHEREAAPVEVHGGKMYAASALNTALNSELASAPHGDVRIGITFRDSAGAICRSFTAPASSGLACRDTNGWRLRGLFAAPEGQTSDYRMAAGMDPNLAALVDSTMAGEPFDATAEAAAKQKGWR
ncbi:MAG: anti-sigma factor family protein [Sphingomicrobium sp.]